MSFGREMAHAAGLQVLSVLLTAALAAALLGAGIAYVLMQFLNWGSLCAT